jgi:hypothetical protein
MAEIALKTNSNRNRGGAPIYKGEAMKYLWGISALLLALALSPVVYGQDAAPPLIANNNYGGQRIDPCYIGQKSSAEFFINTGNFQKVIAGVQKKQIFVCNIVFYGSASAGFNISFAGSSSNCQSGFTILGVLRVLNDTVVSAGGGSSTQFTVPSNNSFCIELGGSTPLESGGWVTYVLM